MKSEFIDLIAKKVALEDYFGDQIEEEDVHSDYDRIVADPVDTEHSVFKNYSISKTILLKVATDFLNDLKLNPKNGLTDSPHYIRQMAARSAFLMKNPDASYDDALLGYTSSVEAFDPKGDDKSGDMTIPNGHVDPLKQQFAAEMKWLRSVLKIFNEGAKVITTKKGEFDFDNDALIDEVAREGVASLECETPKKHHVLFILSETFDVVDEESSANGEAKATGWNWENMDYTPDELSDLLSNEGFNEPSSSRISSRREWMSSYEETNFATGETTTRSIHCTGVKMIDGTILDDERAGRLWAYICNKHLDSIKTYSKEKELESPFMENIGYH